MPSLEENFPHVHLNHTLFEFIDNDSLWDASDFLDAINKHRVNILGPDPFGRNKRSAADRQTLSTQPTPESAKLPSDLKLTNDSFNAIIALSDDLDVNELDCARKWHQATRKDVIEQLSQLSGKGVSFLETNPGYSARLIFTLERTKLLLATVHLFKARYYGGHMHPDKHAVVMEQTNIFLRDGIAMKYMDLIAKGLVELKQGSVGKAMTDFILSSMHIMSESLFFMFYQTQITSAESVALSQLLLELSGCLLDDANGEWRSLAVRSLVVLQLAQIRALNQVDELFSRDVDAAPYSSGVVGNNLPTPLGSKDFMDQVWPCVMAKGLSCLAYAILRQPAVECSMLPSSEVLWFLKQSSVCRAFSYIRCTVLPILQAMHTDTNQQLYLSVLSDLVYNSLTLFTQSNYHSNGFPFPVSQASYIKDDRWRPAGDTKTEIVPPRPPRDTQEDAADCITVLCNAYPPFAVRFWSTSSNDSEVTNNSSSMLNSTARALDSMHHHPFIGRAVDGILQDSVLIVPIFRMLAAIAHGAAALVPSLSSNVIVGAETNIGTIPHSGQACALATYNLIKHKHPGRLDWAYLFHIIESYTQSLLTQQTANKKPGAGAGTSGLTHNIPKLLPKDVDALSAMMELIGAVSHEPSVMRAFVSNGLSPIERLFGLLAAPVPCRLKGKIYQALSVICKTDHIYAHEIWDSLERYDVLSLTPTRDVGSNFYGVRYELEAIESAEGNYSATEGFLCLLEALLTHHKVPDAVGLGYRLPGITGYLDFIIDEILLKASLRSYVIINKACTVEVSSSSSDSVSLQNNGQYWALMCHCIRILGAVIQQYPINELTNQDSGREVLWHFSRMQTQDSKRTWTPEEVAEYSADFSESIREYNIEHIAAAQSSLNVNGNNTHSEILRWPRPKSSGFVVMARLLDSYGAILNCLMGILRDNNSVSLDEVFGRQLEARSKDALQVLITSAIENRGGVDDSIRQSRNQGPWAEYPSFIGASSAAHGYDYGLLSMSPACVDSLFWREKCVNATIGLLYECSLREKRFLQCISNAPPLTIMRNMSGRPTVQELHLCEIFVSLASYQARSPYSIVAHFIRYAAVASRFVVVMPTVPVMAVRILELAAPQGSAAEDRLLRSNDVFIESSPGLFGLGFTRACALALRDPSDIFAGQVGTDPIAVSIATHGVAPPSDMVPIGAGCGGCKHDLFTLTLSDDSNYSSSANVDMEILAKNSDEHPSNRQPLFVNSDESEALSGYSSAQGAVLDFLLRGLNKGRYGVVHKLLGFESCSGRSDDRLMLRTVLNVTGSKETSSSSSLCSDNCLYAALDVLDSMPIKLNQYDNESILGDNSGCGGAMNYSLQTYDVANKCMELLYALCSNPLTSEAVLGLLRQRLVKTLVGFQSSSSLETQRIHSFYASQLQLCLFWCKSPCFNGERDATASQALLHTCRLNYVAWFLKVFALELHTSEISQSSNVSTRQIAKLLSQLFAHNQDIVGGGMPHLYDLNSTAAGPLPITQLLSFLSPIVDVPTALDSPEVISAFTTCSRPYFIGVVASNEALGKRGDENNGSPFALISLKDVKATLLSVANNEANDVTQDNSSVESDISRRISEAIDIAASYNRYTVLMASSSHLCNAWRQVLDVSLLGWGKLLLPQQSEFSELSGEIGNSFLTPNLLIDELMMPVVNLLSRRTDMEMVSAEPLSRSLLSMTAFLREVCAIKIKGWHKKNKDSRSERAWGRAATSIDNNGGAILSESQHDAIVVGLIQAVLRRGSLGSPHITGSVIYRSFLYSALIHTLRMMNVDSSSTVSGEDTSGEYEMAAAEYRVRNMVIMEPYSNVLADTMIRDAVSSNSAPCWKLTAISSLGALLSVLMVSSDDSPDSVSGVDNRGAKRSKPYFTNNTSGYHQVMQQLTSKGHLHDIFMTGLNKGPGNCILDMGLYRAALEMCVPVACNVEGVSILLDNKLLQFINELKPINPIPVLLDDAAGLLSAAEMAAFKQESEHLVDDALTPVLRLFRTMLSVAPRCFPLLEGCALYLQRNRDVVTHLLSLKIRTMKGLVMVKSLVSVISIISAFKGPKRADIGSCIPPRVPIADFFLPELTSLLRRIGTAPIPGLHQADSWNPAVGSKHAVWWTAIQPTTEHDFALVAQHLTPPLSVNAATNAVRQTASRESSTGLGLNRTWSLYDATKLQLGHQILECVASIVRSVLATSEVLQSVSSDFDVAALSEVFNICAELTLFKSYAGENSNLSYLQLNSQSRSSNVVDSKVANQNGENWLTSTNPVMFNRGNGTVTGFGLTNVASMAARAAGLRQAESISADNIGAIIESDKKPKHHINDSSLLEEDLSKGAVAIERSLSFTAENLICAIYSASMILSPKELAVVSNELQESLRFCEQFPAHSFINEVGRWLGKAI